jgi:hypothetical protein
MDAIAPSLEQNNEGETQSGASLAVLRKLV